MAELDHLDLADMYPEGQAWRAYAACRGKDPDIFFPEKGAVSADAAKQVCRQCPVRDACLDYAMKPYQRDGIWGSLTEKERRTERRRRRLKIVDGTNTS